MRLRVLALDYDGTTARDGQLDEKVEAAIREARTAGLVVVLVTGRRLADLRALCGDLRIFDAVVVENGAVIAFPEAGRSTHAAPRCPCGLVGALRDAGVDDAVAGDCLIEADAVHAHAVLSVVREQELPMAIHFNRGRLMLMPLAVSKATGLKEALRSMRLSAHNAVGIGDAENDHELLAVCELGVAVEWGARSLREAADRVLEGAGPPVVADYVRGLIGSTRIDIPDSPRRRLLLGRDLESEDVVSLAVKGRTTLIAGDPRSGKSWVTGLLAEQLILQGYSLCVIDPEGDYTALEALPGVVLMGGDAPAPSVDEIARMLRHADVSVVIDLVRMPIVERRAYVVRVLAMLGDVRRRTGLPHRIVVDEAHYFLHDPAHAGVLDMELGAYTLVTYRASGLHPTVLAHTECVIVTRETTADEARALHRIWGSPDAPDTWEEMLAGLDLDEAILLPVTEEAGGALRRVRIAPRLTRHVRHRHKYLDLGVDPSVAFRFYGDDGAPGPVVTSLSELVTALSRLRGVGIRAHLERGDLSRWLEHAFGDRALADRVRDVEEQSRLERLPDAIGALIRAIQDRYEAGTHAGADLA